MDAKRILEEFLGEYERRPVPAQGLARRVGHLVPQSLRPVARRIVTDALQPLERLRARRLARRGDVRLNLGCGSLALDGWINVDLVGLPVDVAWNLSRPLPFEANSVDAIFHEHVVEHLPAVRGFAFIRECHRVLRPGGIMRAVVPDAAKYIRSYCDPAHEFLNQWRDISKRGIPPLLGLQEQFYGFGHRTIFDFETFVFFCTSAGFSSVEQRAFRDSRLQPCPDSEWRQTDSFYAELVK